MTTKTQCTPLMQQYTRIKEQHKDSILFFRLGDFYEMFDDDARTAAPILEVALTKRQQTPMCGVPFHSANNYIAKLIKKGFRVSICEQVDSGGASGKNLFTRKVVHTITPGTLVEENLLNAKINNYLAAVYAADEPGNGRQVIIGCAVADISTGDFFAFECADNNSFQHLLSRISLYEPREIIVPEHMRAHNKFKEFLSSTAAAVHYLPDNHFDVKTSNSMPERLITGEIKSHSSALSSCGALLQYINTTRPQSVDALKKISFIEENQYCAIDENAAKNLELVEGLSSHAENGSLLEVLDHTCTSMGARNLRQWILHPLLNIDEIKKRQRAIGYFIDESLVRNDIREKLKSFCDLERTLNRLINGSGNGRDCNAIKNSLIAFDDMHGILLKNRSADDTTRLDGLSWFSAPASAHPVPEAVQMIAAAIVETPPISIKEGGIFRKGFNTRLDELREAVSHGKDWIAALEKKERERTGIQKLKIGYTSVFGYYIEITKSHLDKIPADYHRRQTLTGAERFITPELKRMEDTILGAETKAHQLEHHLFIELRADLLAFSEHIRRCAEMTAVLDTITALAEAAARNDYTCPDVHAGWGLDISEGRHPVVERSVRGEGGFIPNDCLMDESAYLWVITGPNMSGKSTFLRQTALIALMAQIGSYVPARKARIGIIDKIFTRIGAADNLAQGESTFMVEMREMAFIFNNLTERSLLILDEVGRGTSTFDGVSIAWASIEYLHNAKPLVLFATHYFELTEIASLRSGVKNYNVDVKEWQNNIIFLHKIVPGSADRSYGVHVADLAGLPKNIIMRAKNILCRLEANAQRSSPAIEENEPNKQQMSFFEFTHPVIDELNILDINKMTPLTALTLLADWKERIKKS